MASPDHFGGSGYAHQRVRCWSLRWWRAFAAWVRGRCWVDVLPTPGIAYLTRYYQADAGAVISASHNTVEYNGIKFFDKNGCKLPDAVEDRIEEIIRNGDPNMKFPVGDRVGRPVRQRNAQRRYIDFVKETTGVRLMVCTSWWTVRRVQAPWWLPRRSARLGAVVSAYYHEPDGTNINENCGSTHPERLCELVRELGGGRGACLRRRRGSSYCGGRTRPDRQRRSSDGHLRGAPEESGSPAQ